MSSEIPAKKQARRKYELIHKQERKERTGQFNTRLPREKFDEICSFLAEHGYRKIALIYAGYNALQEEVRKQQEKEKHQG